jgi:glycerophosphoryl diester phosphodiesterase
MNRIEVHGHRGARAVYPENTLSAFEYAIGVGADALELDLAITKDGEVVVSHDPILKPPICTGPKPEAVIYESTLEELRQWDCGAVPNPQFPHQRPVPGARIPTLDEVFGLARRGDFRFNIETKIDSRYATLAPPPAEFVERVLAIIRRRRLEQRVILQSFDFRTLHEMKRLAPEIELSALYEGPPRSLVSIANEAGAGIVSPEHPLATSEQVRAAHNAGIQVLPWTANDPADWDRLIDAGVDGIITDDPGALIEHLKRPRTDGQGRALA